MKESLRSASFVINWYQHLLYKLYGQSFIKSWGYALSIHIKYMPLLLFDVLVTLVTLVIYITPKDQHLIRLLCGAVGVLLTCAIPVWIQRIFPGGGALSVFYKSSILSTKNFIFGIPQVCLAVLFYYVPHHLGCTRAYSIVFSIITYLGVNYGLFQAYRSILIPKISFDKTRLLKDIEDVRYKFFRHSFWKFLGYYSLTLVKIYMFLAPWGIFLSTLSTLIIHGHYNSPIFIPAIATTAALTFSVPYFIDRMYSGGLIRWIHRWSCIGTVLSFLVPCVFGGYIVDALLHIICYPYISSKIVMGALSLAVLLFMNLAAPYILLRVYQRLSGKLYPTSIESYKQ